MKTFDERMVSILEKGAAVKKQRINKRIAAGLVASVFTVALALVLFVPYSTALPDVSRYANSPYYDVIRGINALTYTPPKYKNNFDALSAKLSSFTKTEAPMSPVPGGDIFFDAPNDAPTMAIPEEDVQGKPGPNGTGKYEEVTDNQVEGVIEADLIKRSDKYIYYLCGDDFYVYTIDKNSSKCVGNRRIDFLEGDGHFYAQEMFLSEDCTTITVLMSGESKKYGSMTALITLDVTDPGKITKTGMVCFTGGYLSSRMVGEEILLICNWQQYANHVNFDDPATFIPQYGTLDSMKLVEGENIVCPEELSNLRYTVIAKVDGKTLEVKDTAALLSYSQELYVSRDTIFATHAFTNRTELEGDIYQTVSMTEITGISYAGEKLEILGSVQVEGRVKDQYSMDQYNGILRVAATTTKQTQQHYVSGSPGGPMADWLQTLGRKTNCSLYCIDLNSWQIAGSVENFAPEGDEVTSARFDGDTAYICTAEVIVLTDPVYFFDLSDITNIIWTDTGIIDGYSSSLINFGDHLLGIGFGGEGQMKLEVYTEGETGVESVAVYERYCEFTNQYKSYYIDRENGLVGIPIVDWEEWEKGNMFYLLLHFDGRRWEEVACVNLDHYGNNRVRATIVDGWLYALYDNQLVTGPVS